MLMSGVSVGIVLVKYFVQFARLGEVLIAYTHSYARCDICNSGLNWVDDACVVTTWFSALSRLATCHD